MSTAPRRPGLALLALSLACGGGEPATAATDTAATSTSSAATDSATDADSATTEATTSADSATIGPTTTADSATAEATTSADETDTAGLPPFELDVHTLLAPDGRLAFAANLPAAVAACQALPHLDPPCADLDQDGLVDAWEDALLDRLRPLRRMDEDEQLFADPTAVIADVGRVARVGDRTRLYVMLGYSKDYGSCGGFTLHNGDSERVALDLADHPDAGPGGVVMVAAYTAAHEGSITDKGAVYSGPGLAELVLGPDPATGEPRWIVYPSADKHATYANVEICEGISPLPCFDEDCAPDDVPDPSAFDLLPDLWGNAGEEAAPRLTDLTPLGFPGDHAWAVQPFCGGLGGSGCSSAVRDKLLIDPF